jgi:hypothetical protein
MFKLFGLVVLVALSAGVFLASLTNFLANSNIGGSGWSLKGNGALFVPFGIGPAFLAMGWSGLVLHYRLAASLERWSGLTLGLGVGIAFMGLLSLMFIHSNVGVGLYSVFSFLPWVFAIIAPTVWGIVPIGKSGELKWLSVRWYLGLGLVYTVVLITSFFVMGKILPS